ncbi:unannotated protein [freshwater metagenome]|uniref:Unannotated protein n=1 Tax=freshwater metagenome TaxID=449393 RepID=A0A6J6NUL4_9ZZZZ
MENEGLIAFSLYSAGEVGLLHGWINHRVFMVFEDSEETVETYIDARGLDHGLSEGLDPHPSGGDLDSDIAVTQ